MSDTQCWAQDEREGIKRISRSTQLPTCNFQLNPPVVSTLSVSSSFVGLALSKKKKIRLISEIAAAAQETQKP